MRPLRPHPGTAVFLSALVVAWFTLLSPGLRVNPLEPAVQPVSLEPIARPARSAAPPRVAPGVTLAGHPVGGLPLARVRRLLEGWAASLAVPPRPAFMDEAAAAKVPHLDGLVPDVEANLGALARARPGENLPLLYRRIPARPASDDLPPAPVRRGNPHRRAVALAVNVDWGEEHLPALLARLSARSAPATFFITGRWAERNPELARAVALRHEVASHGYAATDDLLNRTPAEHARDLALAEEALARATGTRPHLFSPHRGELPPALLQAALARGYLVVLWDVDTVDWRHPGADAIVDRVLAKARPGSIILLHPTADALSALDRLVTGLRRRGYRLVTVGELLNPDPRAPAADPRAST